MASNQAKLDNMNPASHDAEIGTKLNLIIDLLVEVKTKFNAHKHGGITTGSSDSEVPDILLSSTPPDTLN